MKAETILKLIERAREPMLKEAHLKAYAEAMIKQDREMKQKENIESGCLTLIMISITSFIIYIYLQY